MEWVVHRVLTRHPGDLSALLGLIDEGTLSADSIVAIFGKTEGNGCFNDFIRGYALSALFVGSTRAPAMSQKQVRESVHQVGFRHG